MPRKLSAPVVQTWKDRHWLRPLCILAGTGLIWSGLGDRDGHQAARAQPAVRVMASTHVDVSVDEASDEPHIRVRLLDDLGVPLPDRMLRLELVSNSAASHLAHTYGKTNPRGELYWSIEAEPNSRLRILFDGDVHQAPIRQDIQLAGRHPFVEVHVDAGVPFTLDLDRRNPPLMLQLRSAHPLPNLDVVLRDHRAQRVAHARTAGDGAISLEIKNDGVDVGLHRWEIQVSSPTGTLYARRSLSILAKRTARLRLTSLDAGGGRGDVLSGRLDTEMGPLAGKAVGIYGGDTHLATVLTDARGEFTLPLQAQPHLPNTVHARFESDVPWFASVTSSPLQLRETPPTHVWYWIAISFLMSCTLLWFLTRQRTLGSPQASSEEPGTPGVTTTVPDRFIRRSHRRLSGRVTDAATGDAIVHARIRLTATSRSRDVPSLCAVDSRGVFRSSELERGEWIVHVDAPGYGDVQSRLHVPHRGQWEHIEVRLESLRSRALHPYRAITTALLGATPRPEALTPREALDVAKQQQRATPNLEQLTAAVERLCYGSSAPTAAALLDIETQAHQVLRELASPGPSTAS